MIRLQPAAGIQRHCKTGQFRFDNPHRVVGPGEPITERNPFVAGRQIDFNRGMVRIEKRQAAVIQNMVNMRLGASKQIILFAPPFNFSRVIKSQRMSEILVIALKSQW